VLGGEEIYIQGQQRSEWSLVFGFCNGVNWRIWMQFSECWLWGLLGLIHHILDEQEYQLAHKLEQ